MWKWLGLVLTLLVVALCGYTLLQVHETNKKLDHVLATQEKLHDRIKYIEWAINTVPLAECGRWRRGECK